MKVGRIEFAPHETAEEMQARTLTALAAATKKRAPRPAKQRSVDQAYAIAVNRAAVRQRLWRVERVVGDRACEGRLNAIHAVDFGMVFDVTLLTEPSETYVIVWWRWTDDD